MAKTDLAYWRRRIRKQPNSANWFAEISARGVRRKLSLETPNKENAAARARDIYQLAALAGSVANPEKATLRAYSSALRKIVSDSFGLDMGKRKYDPHGGRGEWLKRVHAIRLANLTPQKIQQWKRSFLSSAAPDPISQRAAKTTLNSYLRQACSLFSPKILKHLADIVLPDPLPFADVEFESRQSLKYRTTFDVEALIAKPMDELSRDRSRSV